MFTKKDKKYVFTMEEMNEAYGDISIPDINETVDNIITIMEFMNDDEMIELKEKNENEFNEKIESNFPDFSFKYYNILKMITSGENINHLITMLSNLSKVKNNEMKFDQATNIVNEELNEQYIYPVMAKDDIIKQTKKKRNKRKK